MTPELGSDFQAMSAPEGALRYKWLSSFGARRYVHTAANPAVLSPYPELAFAPDSAVLFQTNKKLALKVPSIQAFSENYALQLLSLLFLLFLFSVMSLLV